jgi:hypothetical protein
MTGIDSGVRDVGDLLMMQTVETGQNYSICILEASDCIFERISFYFLRSCLSN